MLQGLEILGHYGIIMLATVIADANGLGRILRLILLLVEGSHWLTGVGIDLNGPSVYF